MQSFAKPGDGSWTGWLALSARWSPGIIAATTAALAGRLLLLIHRHAVNILFFDQWDLFNSVLNHADLLTLFRWQHGPHRQGCGLFVTRWVGDLSGWNTRAEGFAIAAIVFAALALALALKRRFVGSWDWADVVIPLLFLSPVHFELFVGTPNPAHGALPVFLLMGCVLCGCASSRPIRYGGMLFFNMLMIYTGFGFFIAPITLAVLAIGLLRAVRARQPAEMVWSSAALGVMLVGCCSFFVGYTFQPATERFQLCHPDLLDYLRFVVRMMGHFLGAEGSCAGTVVGGLVLLSMAAVAIYHGYRYLWEGRLASQVICVLAWYSVFFAVGTAYGRVSTGLEAARTSRYAIYLVPGFLGLYFHMVGLERARVRLPLVTALAVIVFCGCGPMHAHDAQAMNWFSEGKRDWRAAYLATGSVEEADRLARFVIYPAPARTHLSQKLQYLRDRNLNLFRQP